jgi:hypothetical protein
MENVRNRHKQGVGRKDCTKRKHGIVKNEQNVVRKLVARNKHNIERSKHFGTDTVHCTGK